MSEPTTSQPGAVPVDAMLEGILAEAEAQRGLKITDGMRDAFQRLADVPTEQRPELLPRLCEALETLRSPTGAGFLAVWLGAAVEGGMDPAPSAPYVVKTLLKWSRALDLDEDDEHGHPESPDPDPDEIIAGMEYLGRAAVAHLGRLPDYRTQLTKDPEVVGELERTCGESVGAMWVYELLRKSSGELLVLHVESKSGFRMTYHNIGNCFHLFTLLQGALAKEFPKAGVLQPDALAIARGERTGDASDSAWWHYGLGTSPKAELGSMIFGEAHPNSIARINGTQVLLLWPCLIGSRMWDAGFFGPHLEASPASVRLEARLSADEIDRWWKALKLPDVPLKAKAKPWWKVW